jgi:Protein of unknown function (DUF2889)
MQPDSGWERGIRIEAGGRDLFIDGAGSISTASARQLRMSVDPASLLSDLSDPSGPNLDDLRKDIVGLRAASGFRARLAELQTAGRLEPSGLTAALLDDLPTVRLVTGYARLMQASATVAPDRLNRGRFPTEEPLDTNSPPAPARGRQSPPLGICAGWRPGGVASTRIRQGLPLLDRAPAAPSLEAMRHDTEDFHSEPEPLPGTMHRRRLLDVWRDGDGWAAVCYLRDSYRGPDGDETSLHEYVIRCSLSGPDFRVRDLQAEPRALPFPDCVLAAAPAARLVGTPLTEATQTVADRLTSTDSCTHLNDTLRFLRFVPHLATLAPEV